MSSTPICEMGEPIGPMLNGMTYIVRPRIEPSKRALSFGFISFGSTQLFVGPASSSFSLQMKVRSSTRATSLGSDHARKEFGRSVSLRRLKVPESSSSWHMRSYSACEPSHHSTLSGLHKAAISLTHAISPGCFVTAAISSSRINVKNKFQTLLVLLFQAGGLLRAC